jgi:hypothetical protein
VRLPALKELPPTPQTDTAISQKMRKVSGFGA